MGTVETDEDEGDDIECTDHRAYLLDSPVLTRGLHFQEDLKFDDPADGRSKSGHVSLSTRLLKLASMNPVIQEVTAASAATLIQNDDNEMQRGPLADLLSRKDKFSKNLDFGGQEDNEYSIFMFDLESEEGG